MKRDVYRYGSPPYIGLPMTEDACKVNGHHNLLFAGDYERKFKLFANLYKMGLAGDA